MRTELTDGNILVRPFRADDVDGMFEAVRESIDELAPWLAWCHPAYSREEASAFIHSLDDASSAKDNHAFAVCDARTNAFLGGVGLNQLNHAYKFANLGYWVRTSCTGRGVASSAARLIAGFGFQELGLQRLELVVAVGNHASQRAAEKAGAQREGVLRKRILMHGQSLDAVMYSLIAEDV
jgi:RimJ/RimL family protein N-acetyltransferase